MKKLLLIAFVAITAILITSCTSEANRVEHQIAQTDTMEYVLQEVTGVAVDGAMNSVYLKIGDDTVEFSYPDLDGDHRASWAINDTLTVRYYETADGDSVIDVINNTDA